MSDYKQSATQRRDFRAGDTGPAKPPPSHKKDTRRWCKGVVGREHNIVTEDWKHNGMLPRRKHDMVIDRCTVCLKELKWRRKYPA
jgi:hypothetical protein